MDNYVIFSHPLPPNKVLEGLAVAWAVSSGKCDGCRLRFRCECGPDFVFPQECACMVKYRELMRGEKDK